MMQRTGKRAATMAARLAEARALRRQAAQILEDCLDMTHTLVRMGDAATGPTHSSAWSIWRSADGRRCVRDCSPGQLSSSTGVRRSRD